MVRSIFTNFQLLFNWLYVSTPAFPVKGDQVSILNRPDEFYTNLINRCSQATKRIVLASLYLGTGDKEQILVDTINARGHEMGSTFTIKILLDNLRGSRGEMNSRKMLLPLLNENPSSQVAMYNTPKLSGILSQILPQRCNELIGLQHMKIYVVDDDVLISGANLSNDYFTNRQDRYVLIKENEEIADFFDGLVSIVCDMSLQLNKDDTLSVLGSRRVDVGNYKINVNKLRYYINNYYSSYVQPHLQHNDSGCDTWIFPTIEIPPCDIHVDSTTLHEVLLKSPANSSIQLASGYFNLNEKYVETILKKKENKYDVLVAHPTANGFYKSNGLSRYIPEMYTCLTEQFLQKIELNHPPHHVHIHEYRRPSWTFHCKGLWITPQNETTPQLTVIGSSNLGARSQDRDLESQLVIITENEHLRNQLQKEKESMFQFSKPFNRTVLEEENRLPRAWMNILLLILRSFF